MLPKFRAWHKHKKIMTEVSELNFDKGDLESISTNHGHFWKTQLPGLAIENLILMQSTGLKDKNGVEIFAGDVLEYISLGCMHRDCNGYRTSADCVECPEKIEDKTVRTSVVWVDYEWRGGTSPGWKNTEIIGNIYEKPELLEPPKAPTTN